MAAATFGLAGADLPGSDYRATRPTEVVILKVAKQHGVRGAPSFIDLGDLTARLVRVLGITSPTLRVVLADIEQAIDIAGPAAIVDVLAEEGGLTQSQARRLIGILREVSQKRSGTASGGTR